METAPSWGIEPVPERLRLLGALDGFLLWANLSVSLLVIVAGAFLVLPVAHYGLPLPLPGALAARGARGDRGGGGRRQPDARARRLHRRRRAGAADGAPPGPARPPRL